MKRIFKNIVRHILPLYLGCVIGNLSVHSYVYYSAKKESQKEHYGRNLKQQWVDFSEYHRKRITNPKVLIPFSSATEKAETPLKKAYLENYQKE